MTAVTDAKVIIDILTGGSLEGARIVELVEQFIRYDPVLDAGWTNEDKAQAFLNVLKAETRSRIQGNKRATLIRAQEAIIQQQVVDIASDFGE